MSLNKMVQGVNYDTTTLKNNVNELIDLSDGLSSYMYEESKPDGFVWPDDLPEVKAYRIGDQFGCSVTPYDLFNPSNLENIYYVDIEYGDNTNNGTSPKTPVQSIWKAIEKATDQAGGEGSRIMIKSAFYPVEHSFLNGDASTDFENRKLTFEAQHGRVTVSMSTSMQFIKDAGYTNVYTAVQADSIFALNPSIKSDDGYSHLKYKSVFSIQDVEDNEGAFYVDTATDTCYVHPHGSVSANNENVRVILNRKQISGSNTNSMLLVNLDLEGGRFGAVYEANAGRREGEFVAVGCTFRYELGGTFDTPVTWSTTSNKNFKILAFFNCDASRNSKDSFSISKTTGQDPALLTVNCTARDNGLLTEEYATGVKPSSCNGFTLHQGVSGLDIGGVYTGSAGTNVAIVDDGTMAWCFGTTSGGSDGDLVNGKTITYGGFSSSGTGTNMWLDSAKTVSTEKSLLATSAGTINVRRSQFDGSETATTGTIQNY